MPGTHVAVLTLMGLEKPPTACGVSFPSMAICPYEIAEKPPQGQLHPCGAFIKDPQNPTQVPNPSLKGGDFVQHSQPTHMITLFEV